MQAGGDCRRSRVYHHSGNAPAVKAKARQRIEDAADRMARELLKMAVDENVSDAVNLAAIRDALDRAGLSARTAVSVEVGRRPFEEIFDAISGVSREASRRARGYADADVTPALAPTPTSAGPPDDVEIIDAEPLTVEYVDRPDRDRYTPPAVTGLDALAEAHRVNEASGVYAQQRAIKGRRR